jgi:hypothetical protein
MSNSRRQYRDGVVYLPNDNSPYTGEYTSYYKNGQIKVSGHYKRGLKNGIWEAFNENGQLYASQGFKNNLKDGIFLLKDVDATILAKGLYENDIAIGEWTLRPWKEFNIYDCIDDFDCTGIHSPGPWRKSLGKPLYCSDKFQPHWKNFNPLLFSGSLADSKMSGLWTCYGDGEVLESAFFDNGNQTNTKYYLNNKELSTHPELVPIFLGLIGLSTVIFVITGEGLITWLFFCFSLLLILLLTSNFRISRLHHLNKRLSMRSMRSIPVTTLT